MMNLHRTSSLAYVLAIYSLISASLLCWRSPRWRPVTFPCAVPPPLIRWSHCATNNSSPAYQHLTSLKISKSARRRKETPLVSP